MSKEQENQEMSKMFDFLKESNEKLASIDLTEFHSINSH